MACYKDAADLHADLEEYPQAIARYEQVADHCRGSNLTKYSVKDYWSRSILCCLAMGVSVLSRNRQARLTMRVFRTPSPLSGISSATGRLTRPSHRQGKPSSAPSLRRLWRTATRTPSPTLSLSSTTSCASTAGRRACCRRSSGPLVRSTPRKWRPSRSQSIMYLSCAGIISPDPAFCVIFKTARRCPTWSAVVHCNRALKGEDIDSTRQSSSCVDAQVVSERDKHGVDETRTS
jgi:hypothetical protein